MVSFFFSSQVDMTLKKLINFFVGVPPWESQHTLLKTQILKRSLTEESKNVFSPSYSPRNCPFASTAPGSNTQDFNTNKSITHSVVRCSFWQQGHICVRLIDSIKNNWDCTIGWLNDFFTIPIIVWRFQKLLFNVLYPKFLQFLAHLFDCWFWNYNISRVQLQACRMS